MSLKMTIRLAMKNIRANRLRSGLTILGLVIGIASVILLVGLVNGATQSINQDVASMGADVVSVYLYDDSKAFEYSEMEQIRELDHVADATPYVNLFAHVTKDGKKVKGTTLVGAGESYSQIMGFDIESGRALSRIDVMNSTKAVIIGHRIAEKYWGKKDPCGGIIKIGGDNYTVVGVMKGKGSSMGNNIDKTVIMPISTSRYLGEQTNITELYVRASSENEADAACKSIKKYIKRTKNLTSDWFDVQSQKMMLDAMEEINRTLSLLLGGIASISLLVGGIGVMNVMPVSVTERTREIGIRKSLGAKRRDILYQFLIESVVLSVFGGIVGIIIGLLLGRIAMLISGYFAPGVMMILIAAGVSVGVGLIFGIIPARRAASMKPVDALRYE